MPTSRARKTAPRIESEGSVRGRNGEFGKQRLGSRDSSDQMTQSYDREHGEKDMLNVFGSQR